MQSLGGLMYNLTALILTLVLSPLAGAASDGPASDPVKQCTVRAYNHKKPVGEYFNYAEGSKEEVCADAINQ